MKTHSVLHSNLFLYTFDLTVILTERTKLTYSNSLLETSVIIKQTT